MDIVINRKPTPIDYPEISSILRSEGEINDIRDLTKYCQSLLEPNIIISKSDIYATLSRIYIIDCSLKTLKFTRFYPNVKELNLSFNCLTSFAGIDCFPNLEILNISNNIIKSVGIDKTNSLLNILDVSNNNIKNVIILDDLSSIFPNIKEIKIFNNPICNILKYEYYILTMFKEILIINKKAFTFNNSNKDCNIILSVEDIKENGSIFPMKPRNSIVVFNS